MNREKTPDSESKKMERTENDKYSMSLWEQISTYLGIVVGVLFSSAAMQMKSGTPLNLNISFTSILLSLVIAFVILPVAYEKLNVNPASPIMIRIGFAVQHGVFWQVLFGSIGKLVG
ncbi:MAG: hypothetical protein WAV76_01810 [Bacteroidota bacterium]